MDYRGKSYTRGSEIRDCLGIFDCSPLVFFSLSIIFVSIKKVFQSSTQEQEVPQTENSFQENGDAEVPFPGEVTPEVMEWFFSKGLDLNGKPLPTEFLEKEEL